MRIEVLVDMHGFVWNNTEIPCTPYPVSPTGDIWQNSSKYHNLDIGNDYNWLMLFSVLICVCVLLLWMWKLRVRLATVHTSFNASSPIHSKFSLPSLTNFLHPQDHQGPRDCAWQWAILVTLPLFYISLRRGLSGSFALHGGPYCLASHISKWRRRQGFDGIKGEV